MAIFIENFPKGTRVQLTLDSKARYAGVVARFTKDQNKEIDGILLTHLCVLFQDGRTKACSKSKTSRKFKFSRIVGIHEEG